MQLAPVATITPLATADFNLHVLRTSEVDEHGSYVVDTSAVTFDPANREGGYTFHSVYVPGGGVRVQATHVAGTDRERAAAQAVRDAVIAAGLLEQAKPADWKGRPNFGYTRIYLDRRSSYVEFPNDAPTPGIQAVLDAVAAWARRG